MKKRSLFYRGVPTLPRCGRWGVLRGKGDTRLLVDTFQQAVQYRHQQHQDDPGGDAEAADEGKEVGGVHHLQVVVPGLLRGVGERGCGVNDDRIGKMYAVVGAEDDATQGKTEREGEEVQRDHLRSEVRRRDFGGKRGGNRREQQFAKGDDEDGEGEGDQPHHHAAAHERHEEEVAAAEDEHGEGKLERGFRLFVAEARPQRRGDAGEKDNPQALQRVFPAGGDGEAADGAIHDLIEIDGNDAVELRVFGGENADRGKSGM